MTVKEILKKVIAYNKAQEHPTQIQMFVNDKQHSYLYIAIPERAIKVLSENQLSKECVAFIKNGIIIIKEK